MRLLRFTFSVELVPQPTGTALAVWSTQLGCPNHMVSCDFQRAALGVSVFDTKRHKGIGCKAIQWAFGADSVGLTGVRVRVLVTLVTLLQ